VISRGVDSPPIGVGFASVIRMPALLVVARTAPASEDLTVHEIDESPENIQFCCGFVHIHAASHYQSGAFWLNIANLKSIRPRSLKSLRRREDGDPSSIRITEASRFIRTAIHRS
jgi:hypothetical protein